MRTLLIGLLAAACTEPDPVVPQPTETPDPELGNAPDFNIIVQDGSTFRASDHAGDVLLIDISGFT